MTLKTSGEQQQSMSRWVNRAWITFVVLYLLATIATFFSASFLFQGLLRNPLFWVLLVLLLASVLYIPVAVKGAKYAQGFAASSVTIASLMGLVALSLFPRLVPSSLNLAYSLTIYNASSTPRTLITMLVIALIGMPLVIAYTIFIYWVFRGKATLIKESY
jgi:cytochrome d ubiquinol oxidase subunit II